MISDVETSIEFLLVQDTKLHQKAALRRLLLTLIKFSPQQ